MGTNGNATALRDLLVQYQAEPLIQELVKHINNKAGLAEVLSSSHTGYNYFQNWRVGIARDPHTRTLQHIVNGKSMEGYTWVKTPSVEVAQKVESELIRLGCAGGSGGTLSELSLYVYVGRE